MGADISQFKQADLVRHIPDLTKIEEHGDGEGTGKFSIKSHSKPFAHFSDYSMFPDRYNVKSSPKAILGNTLFATTVESRFKEARFKKESQFKKDCCYNMDLLNQ